MYKKNLIFTIEVKAREMIPKCHLALEAIQAGFRVYIGTFTSVNFLMPKVGPNLILHKSGYRKRAQKYKEKYQSVFTVMDEEAGVAIPRSMRGEFCRVRYDHFNSDKYDHMFVIGEGYAKLLSRMPNMQGINVHVTGWPRIDLWRPEYAYLYDSEKQRIKAEHGDYVLVITSFGVTSENSFRKLMKHPQAAVLSEIYEHKYEAFQEYLDMLIELSAKYDGKIVVRPHPSESLEDWRALLADCKNVHVERSGDVTPWLLAAKALVVYGSTVAVQALLNGIPSVQYRIKQQQGITDTAVFEASQAASSVDELLQFISRDKGVLDSDSEERLSEIGSEISALRGETAASNLVRELDAIAVESTEEASFSAFERWGHAMWKAFKNSECKLLKRFGTVRACRSDKVPGGISADEIGSQLKSLAQAHGLGDSDTIRCEQLTEDLVLLEVRTPNS